MTLAEFNRTLDSKTPPAVSPALVALWYDAKGEWSRAHEVAQDEDDATGAWVHAYLHRKRETRGTRVIGTGGLASPPNTAHSTPSGRH